MSRNILKDALISNILSDEEAEKLMTSSMTAKLSKVTKAKKHSLESGKIFTVNGIPFKAKTIVNQRHSKYSFGTWDLVLYNDKERISITAQEFFSYTQDGELLLCMKLSNPVLAKPDQNKPLVNGFDEKHSIENLCTVLSDHLHPDFQEALDITFIKDPHDKLKLN
jgi:hypothetical protein